MRKVLLPVDGSTSAFQATLYIIDFIRINGPIEVHVVNVQPKIPELLMKVLDVLLMQPEK